MIQNKSVFLNSLTHVSKDKTAETKLTGVPFSFKSLTSFYDVKLLLRNDRDRIELSFCLRAVTQKQVEVFNINGWIINRHGVVREENNNSSCPLTYLVPYQIITKKSF